MPCVRSRLTDVSSSGNHFDLDAVQVRLAHEEVVVPNEVDMVVTRPFGEAERSVADVRFAVELECALMFGYFERTCSGAIGYG